jgi:hypothetical protein
MTEPLRLAIEEEFPAPKFAMCADCIKQIPEGTKMYKALPRWQTEREQKLTSLDGREVTIDVRMNVCQGCVDLNNRALAPKEEKTGVTSRAHPLDKLKKKTKARKRRNILPEEE